jgi:ubiquinone/menaquinone biosynthesis C-methylase UbiE
MTDPLTPEGGPSPDLFFQAVNAHQRTAALKTALDLGLFTAIAEGSRTPSALAGRCGASERGMRMLADYLAVADFLTKHSGEYRLTPESALFLDSRSPGYLGAALDFMLSPPLMEGFQQLTRAVQKGGTVVGEQGTLAPEHPEWVTFARSMAPLMRGPAQWIADWVAEHAGDSRRVLDVAAGHGLFGVEVAKRLPQAEITALDWSNVLTVAQERADSAGIQGRFRTIAGSAFEVDLGRGYDVVLLTNFLHHFDVETCESLLKRVHASLIDKGRVITLEFIPNEDRISPPPMAEFCLTMLITTPAGDAYTFGEYEQMFRHAGFIHSELHDVPASNQRVMITRK